MRVNIYLNRNIEEKLNIICKNFKSRSECIKKIIEEYENCTTFDELMLELQLIEGKLDQCLNLRQNPLNRAKSEAQ
jgi:hypothetical protein